MKDLLPFAIAPAVVAPGERKHFLIDYRERAGAPHEPFRPVRIYGGDQAEGLVIADVLIGDESYFMPGESMPAGSSVELFHCRVVHPGMDCTIVVCNPTEGELTFSCAVVLEIHAVPLVWKLQVAPDLELRLSEEIIGSHHQWMLYVAAVGIHEKLRFAVERCDIGVLRSRIERHPVDAKVGEDITWYCGFSRQPMGLLLCFRAMGIDQVQHVVLSAEAEARFLSGLSFAAAVLAKVDA